MQHLSGVHADADPQRGRREPDRRAELLHRADQREARPHRALGVVVSRPGNAEQGDDGVADVLLEHTSVPLDRPTSGVEVRILDRAQVLRVEAVAERGEAGEISEQRGNHAAFERRHRDESNLCS